MNNSPEVHQGAEHSEHQSIGKRWVWRLYARFRGARRALGQMSQTQPHIRTPPPIRISTTILTPCFSHADPTWLRVASARPQCVCTTYTHIALVGWPWPSYRISFHCWVRRGNTFLSQVLQILGRAGTTFIFKFYIICLSLVAEVVCRWIETSSDQRHIDLGFVWDINWCRSAGGYLVCPRINSLFELGSRCCLYLWIEALND